MGAHDLDVQVGIAHAVADLLVGAASSEDRKGVCKGLEASRGHAGGDADHVALGNAAVKEAFGIGGGEILGHRGLRQVGVQDDELGIPLGQLDQRLAIGAARCDFSCHFSFPPVL